MRHYYIKAWGVIFLLIIVQMAMGADLMDPNAAVEKVKGGFQFTEGVAADSQGDIYFSDIPNSKIYKWMLDGTLSVFQEESRRANGLCVDKQGHILACTSTGGGRPVSIDPNGTPTVIIESYEGKKFNSLNDLWIDPQGGIYLTDPRYGSRDGMEQDGEHVYYLAPDHKTVIRVINDMVGPNGVTGTTDGKTLYVADHKGNKTFVYDIQEDGTLANKRLFTDEGSDGMTLDESGNVYLTNKDVKVYSPEGKLLKTIEVPEGSTNVCFGGQDGKTLFITARTSVYKIQMLIKGVWSN